MMGSFLMPRGRGHPGAEAQQTNCRRRCESGLAMNPDLIRGAVNEAQDTYNELVAQGRHKEAEEALEIISNIKAAHLTQQLCRELCLIRYM